MQVLKACGKHFWWRLLLPSHFFFYQPSLEVVFKISFVNRPPNDEGAMKWMALTAHAQYDHWLWAVLIIFFFFSCPEMNEVGWRRCETDGGERSRQSTVSWSEKLGREWRKSQRKRKGQGMSNGTKGASFQRDCTGQINRLKRETRGAKQPREDNNNDGNRNQSMTECVRGRAPNPMETSQQRNEGVGLGFLYALQHRYSSILESHVPAHTDVTGSTRGPAANYSWS